MPLHVPEVARGKLELAGRRVPIGRGQPVEQRQAQAAQQAGDGQQQLVGPRLEQANGQVNGDQGQTIAQIGRDPLHVGEAGRRAVAQVQTQLAEHEDAGQQHGDVDQEATFANAVFVSGQL